MPPPSANSTWFNFSISGGPDFAVYAFSGWERISSPYNFTIDLVSPFASVKLIELIGREACLSIFDRSGSSRLVHGVIREMQQLHTANLRTFYRAILVPRLFFLDSRRNHKIFQRKSVPDIISEILEEQNFTSESFAFKCFHKYQPREYCVQYGESDLYFISRLCEEEGIYYYFEHSREGHRLCFSDMPGGPRINGESNLRYCSGSGQVADTAVVSRTRLRSQGVSDKTLLRDWNFITPTAILDGSASEPDFAKAPGASGVSTEIYIYPNIYQTRAEAERYAEIQFQRQLTFQTWLEAESDASRFLPGFTFSLHGHDQEGLNSGWWITSVAHRGEQPQVLEHEAPDRGQFYASTLTAIPENVRFVPENMHPKKRVPGAQTAIVTGPEGEEIYPDEYGRVKVQFFWDREGKKDEKTTCWIRPSQGWAGTGFGDMAIPRIGHEVVVTFLEGDPDRPVITGRVYHGGNTPPYDLPEHKTRTVFRSRSTPDGKGPRGFNEFCIEDKAGEEEIYVRAEKDMNIHVKNDWKKHILRDRRQHVDNYDYTHIKGETHISLNGQRKTELRSDDHLTINADSHVRIDQQWLLKAGTEIHVASGARILLEAGAELTVKAGGSWIKLDASGVSINGKKIYISGGGNPKIGAPAFPILPNAALIPRKELAFPVKAICKSPINSAQKNSNTILQLPLKVIAIKFEEKNPVPCSKICIIVTKFNRNTTEEERKKVVWRVEKVVYGEDNEIISKKYIMLKCDNSIPSLTIKLCNLEEGTAEYTFTPYLDNIKQDVSKSFKVYSMNKIREYINTTANVIPRNMYTDRIDNISELVYDCDYIGITIHHAGDFYTENSKPDDTYSSDLDGIPYHYIIDYRGNIYEGRNIKYKGSHVKNANSMRIVICFLGDYAPQKDSSIFDIFTGPNMYPNYKNISAIKRLIECLIKIFNITELAGHREIAELVNVNLTTCPGDFLMPVVNELRNQYKLNPPIKGQLIDDIEYCL